MAAIGPISAVQRGARVRIRTSGADDDGGMRHALPGVVLHRHTVGGGVAIWLADTMADMRRNQDCVLSGRRGCTPVEYERVR